MCEIANKIKARRVELGLTLEEVGRAVGVGRSTVQRWESGLIKNMGRDKIAALANILQMNAVELVPSPALPWEQAAEKAGLYDSISGEDHDRLEALHQNPKLRLLFDLQKKLSDSDLNAVLGITQAIAKERGDDD